MIPAFRPDGNLPSGIHWATWQEVVDRFGGTPERAPLVNGLRRALEALQAAGCPVVYIDGSFVSTKPDPNDFDACWEMTGIDRHALDPIFTTFDPGRRAQKARFGGELFPADGIADLYGTTFLDFFQIDKRTRRRKGIVAISLELRP
jgi:hypothetical protein